MLSSSINSKHCERDYAAAPAQVNKSVQGFY